MPPPRPIGVFIIIYTAQAFWVWNANQVAWAASMGLPGWMFGYNVLDWSGGLTVHGFAGLVCLVTGWLTGMKRVAQDFGSAQVPPPPILPTAPRFFSLYHTAHNY